jgi:hypothetical protein
MSENIPFFSVVGLASIVAVICWRLIDCHASTYGADVRSRDRERQDFLRTITQFAEKIATLQVGVRSDVADVTRMHMAERDHSATLNADMEKKAGENGKKPEPLVTTADPEVGAMYR